MAWYVLDVACVVCLATKVCGFNAVSHDATDWDDSSLCRFVYAHADGMTDPSSRGLRNWTAPSHLQLHLEDGAVLVAAPLASCHHAACLDLATSVFLRQRRCACACACACNRVH